jgi:tetratricopeptide (TPR) repeat protein
LSQLLVEQGSFAAAESELRAALRIEEDNPQLLTALGDCQLNQGHHEAADSTFQRALERSSSTGAIAARIAQLYYRRGMRHKTIEYYERAIVREPDNAFVLNNLAWTYAGEAMHLHHATELSLRAIKTDGENPVYLDTFAELLYLQRQYRRALAVIRRAVDLEPENGEHWTYLQGQHDKMRRALTQTARLP